MCKSALRFKSPMNALLMGSTLMLGPSGPNPLLIRRGAIFLFFFFVGVAG